MVGSDMKINEGEGRKRCHVRTRGMGRDVACVYAEFDVAELLKIRKKIYNRHWRAAGVRLFRDRFSPYMVKIDCQCNNNSLRQLLRVFFFWKKEPYQLDHLRQPCVTIETSSE